MNKILYGTLFTILLFSCKHDLEQPTWEVDMIVPIAHSEMNLADLVTENTNSISITTDSDSLISLVYSTNLLNTNYDSLLNINTITEPTISKVKDINFQNIHIRDTTTIGSVISGVPLGNILYPDGGSNVIPAIPAVASNDSSFVDGSEFFETMTLTQGYLGITIKNGFPSDISNIQIILLNANNLSTIANFNYPFIASGTSLKDSVDISGTTLDKNIIAIIVNMDLEASNGVVAINYSDAITTTISLTELIIFEATAVFPEQEISKELKETSLGNGDAQLREIKIKEGEVKLIVLSTLPDTGRISYFIPSLTKNGVPFHTNNIIPPTQFGEWTTLTHNFDGYILDLTGKEGREGGDTINTIYSEMIAYIDSTGDLVTLTEMDSFCTYVALRFVPEYAKGYIGQDTFVMETQSRHTTAFDNILSGTLNIEQVNVNLSIENNIGADASITFTEFSADNTNDNSPPVSVTTDINGNNIIGNPYLVNRASLNNNQLPITATHTTIALNAAPLLNIQPNYTTIGATFILNPNGQQAEEDFIYPDFPINANLNTTIPLSFIANNLTFQKTINTDLSNNTELEVEQLYITIKNGLPLSANIQIIMMDEYENIVDTLITNKEITSAITDAENKVVSSSETLISITNTNYNNVKKMKIIASFSTSSLSQHVDILSTYTMDISLSARFKKIIGQ